MKRLNDKSWIILEIEALILIALVCLVVGSVQVHAKELNEEGVRLFDINGNDITAYDDYALCNDEVYFSFDDVQLNDNESIICACSIDGGSSFGSYSYVKNGRETVMPRLGASYAYRFFVIDSEGNICRRLQAVTGFYGIEFIEETEGPDTYLELDSFFEKDGIVFARGKAPMLTVKSQPLISSFVRITENGKSDTYEVTGELSVCFEEGSYSVEVYSQQSSGKQISSAGYPLKLVYDNTAPFDVVLSISAKDKGALYKSRNDYQIFSSSPVTISVETSDSLSGIASTYISVDGERFETDSYTIDGGSAEYICAWAVDKCGNTSKLYECDYEILVEDKNPEIHLLESSLDDDKKGLTINVSDNGSGLDYVDIRWNDKSVGGEENIGCKSLVTKKSYFVTIPENSLIDVKDGSAVLYVTAVDCAGNSTELAQKIMRGNDENGPAITISGVNDRQILGRCANLKVSIEDDDLDESSVSIESVLKINGKEITKKWSTQQSLSFSEDGEYELFVKAQDLQGNETQEDISFSIDTTPPVIKGISEIDGASYRLFCIKDKVGGMFQDATIVSYRFYLNGMDFSETDTVTDPGKYHFLVVAYDTAGNMSQEAADFVISEDEVPFESEEMYDEIKKETISKNVISANAYRINTIEMEQMEVPDVKSEERESDALPDEKEASKESVSPVFALVGILILGLAALAVAIAQRLRNDSNDETDFDED